MKRREFIRAGCGACLGGMLLSSCNTTKFVAGTANDNGILVALSEFLTSSAGENKYRQYLIVRNEILRFPICVYRLSETKYSALWMECTHQGAEVQIAGDHLVCPAHGSEFNNTGNVTGGPASNPLRQFPVTLQEDQIFIDLRKK